MGIVCWLLVDAIWLIRLLVLGFVVGVKGWLGGK